MNDGDTHVHGWTPEGEVPPTGKPSEAAIIDAISTIYDPEIPVNIFELGLIYAVEIGDDNAVKVEMTLTTPNCPSAQELPQQVKDMVEKVPNVAGATVAIVWEPAWSPDRMSEDARLALNMY